MANPIVRQSGGPAAESVSLEELVVCAHKDQEFTTRDVVEAALFRGDLDPLWQDFLHRVAAEKHVDDNELDLEDDMIDAGAEQFRYAHDLITAEETEQWLASRGLSLDDFGTYFARQVAWQTFGNEVKPDAVEYRSAPDELRQLFMADLILSDQLERLTNDFSWRFAALVADEGTARAESEAIVAAQRKAFLKRTNESEAQMTEWLSSIRRDQAWLDQMLKMEAEFQQRHNVVLTPQARQREMHMLRLPLTRFEAEVIEVESRDAAQEARLLCEARRHVDGRSGHGRPLSVSSSFRFCRKISRANCNRSFSAFPQGKCSNRFRAATDLRFIASPIKASLTAKTIPPRRNALIPASCPGISRS